MCLIEYPEWDTGGKPEYQDDVTDYGSIGEFYDALEYGARQLAGDIGGPVNQVDLFSAFYRDLPTMTVQTAGRAGWPEVAAADRRDPRSGRGSEGRRRDRRALPQHRGRSRR